MALAHPGSLLVCHVLVVTCWLLRAGCYIRLAAGDHRPELVHRLPGVEQLALGAHLPPLHPMELGDLMRGSFLARLPKALVVSLGGEALLDIHGDEDLFALCAYVCLA
jgi:hypothetical protein